MKKKNYKDFIIDNPQKYFEQVVLPNYKEYMEGYRAGSRLAMNLAITAFHLIDYMFNYYYKKRTTR